MRMCIIIKSYTFSISAHRLAWLIHSGAMPDAEIDHINGIKSDNRISNLRCVTHEENSRNKAKYSNNTSGVSGVTWDSREGKWRAHVKAQKKQNFLGLFHDINEAAKAVTEFRMANGYTERHGT